MTTTSEDQFELEPEAVGLLVGATAAAGQAILTLERALYGFGLVEEDETGKIRSATNLFGDYLPFMLDAAKTHMSKLYGELLEHIPGHEDYVARIDQLKKGAGYGREP